MAQRAEHRVAVAVARRHGARPEVGVLEGRRLERRQPREARQVPVVRDAVPAELQIPQRHERLHAPEAAQPVLLEPELAELAELRDALDAGDAVAEEPQTPEPRALVQALELADRVLLRVEPAQLGQRPQAPQVREPLVRDAQALQRLRDGPQAPDGLEAAVDEAQPPQPRAAAQTAPVPVVVVAAERDGLQGREDDLELVEAVVLLDAHARRLLDERARDALLLGRLRGAHG